MSYVDTILMRDEQVVQKAKITKLFLIWPWIKGILLCWLLFIPTIKAIKLTITAVASELVLTNKRVVGKVGAVARSAMDAKLDKVQTVKISETFWGRIFNYATVTITTAGTGGNDYVFMGIARANDFNQKVNAEIDAYEEAKVQKQAQALANVMNN